MFQYFFPGINDRTHVTVDLVQQSGLGDVLADFLKDGATLSILRSAANNVYKGPAGHRGVLVSPIAEDQNPQGIGYHPGRQTWQKIGGRYWFGYEPENLPSPESLRRMTPLIPGIEFELGDGRVWTAPIIRHPVWDEAEADNGKVVLNDDRGECYLPEFWGVDADGKFISSVLPEYMPAFRMAGEMANAWAGVREINPEESLSYCVRCLALNYRIGPHEATALRLFNTTNYGPIFKAAFNGIVLEQLFESVVEETAEAE